MRKHVSIAMVFVILICSIGCNKQSQPNLKEEKSKFDIKIATNITNQYLKFISLGKYESANEILTDKAKSNLKDIKQNNLRIIGYRIDAISENAGEGNFKASIVKANAIKPETQILEYRIKVIKYGIDYKIDQITVLPMKEAFQISDEIRIRKEGEVDTNLVTYMDGIPQYVYSKNDVGKMNSKQVPKKGYGLIVLDYTGDIMAISTFDEKSTFFGILSFEETVQTQAPEESSQSNVQGDQKSTNMIKEKPIGKQLVTCDILDNTTVTNMVFSQNEKLLAVQYKMQDKICVKVYDVTSGELIDFLFEEEYPLNKVNVIFKSFEVDKMKYEIVPKDNKDKNNKYVGQWELDIKTFKASKDKK